MVEMRAGVLHEVMLEYVEQRDGAAVTLEWQANPLPREVVPSSALFHPVAAALSTIAVAVRPAQPCAATSQLLGGALTLATAGRRSRFSLLSRDCFGNAAPSLMPSLKPVWTGLRHADATPMPRIDGSEHEGIVEYVPRSSGEYLPSLTLIDAAGLTMDGTCPETCSELSECAEAMRRLQGFLRVDDSGVYRFFAENDETAVDAIASATIGAEVLIGSSDGIDGTVAVSNTEPLLPIRLEYRYASCRGSLRRWAEPVQWQPADAGKEAQPLPHHRLFSGTAMAAPPLVVRPSTAILAQTILSGAGLTVATAGRQATIFLKKLLSFFPPTAYIIEEFIGLVPDRATR